MSARNRPVPNAARGGRAIGAMFFSGFGGVWLALWAFSEFTPPVFALSAVAVGTLALLIWSMTTYRQHVDALRTDNASPQGQRRSRRFNLINAGQWVVIVVVAGLLSWLQHPELILPAVIAVIGLHFLPLARLFAYPPHYLTGTALLVLALSYPVLSAEGARSATGALGTGVVLWLSAVWALLPHGRSTPSAD